MSYTLLFLILLYFDLHFVYVVNLRVVIRKVVSFALGEKFIVTLLTLKSRF